MGKINKLLLWFGMFVVILVLLILSLPTITGSQARAELDALFLEVPDEIVEEVEQDVIAGEKQIFSIKYEGIKRMRGIDDTFVQETNDYDYSRIYSQAKYNLLREEVRGMDIQKAIPYIAYTVVNDVEYDLSTINREYCEQSSASEVLADGKGVCSTMSKVLIAMLRGAGILSKAHVGCTTDVVNCRPILTTFDFYKKPTTNNVIEGDRIVMGGNLHAWVEVWEPRKGWMIVEATTGEVVSNQCNGYILYAEEGNFNQSIDICSADKLIYGDRCELI